MVTRALGLVAGLALGVALAGVGPTQSAAHACSCSADIVERYELELVGVELVAGDGDEAREEEAWGAAGSVEVDDDRLVVSLSNGVAYELVGGAQ
jgi:hypothetical protein